MNKRGQAAACAPQQLGVGCVCVGMAQSHSLQGWNSGLVLRISPHEFFVSVEHDGHVSLVCILKR